ncbi:MAG TPA: C-GCAxxG-C-C family protein [Syntrophales bacterium]|nr:C-GCAxxG-C-C family protein [Syntrophales bacterium]
MLSVAESKNIQSDLIPKIATGFCGGLSRTCGMCGAVSGAVMAMNIFYGRDTTAMPYEKSYAPVQKMIKMFVEKFGSTNCKELIGVDLGTEEGRKRFHVNNLREKCRNITEEATGMAMSLIEEESL